MLKECVVKVVNQSGNENCSQDHLRLERTRSDTPGYKGSQELRRFGQALGNREQVANVVFDPIPSESRNWPDEEFTKDKQ